MRKLIIAVLVLAGTMLSGCEADVYPKYEASQVVRQRLFKECLQALPAGPSSTKYNDWDEVVEACGNEAYRQSLYCYENCPPGAPVAIEPAKNS
jgi:hypothetical protein